MLKCKDAWRLRFHLMPPDGWLNDPNGLCQFHGIYHVFFQYAPNEPAPDGRMARTWGHYAGKDLLHLKYEGVPFWPEELDHDGCYSGSALLAEDAIWLYYTGNIKQPGDYDYIHDGRISNTILVKSDGESFGEKKFLFGTDEYPKECTRHVRDPKVWKENDSYYMVQGARLQDDRGAILYYKSPDLQNWKLLKIQTTAEPFGYMWECPDYLTVEGQTILSLCPQGLPAQEFAFQNIHQAGYYQVDGSIEGEQSLINFREWDFGFDFYAQQTFVDEAGRTLLFGWVGLPDKPYENPTASRGWENALTVPRVLTNHDGVIYQNPVEELKELRSGETTISGDGSFLLEEGTGDIVIHFSDAKPWHIQIGAGVWIAFQDGVLSLSLSDTVGRGRTIRKLKIDTVESLRLLIDTSLLEIYVNEGAYALTTRFYPDYDSDGTVLPVQFSCKNAAITGWQMKTMETNKEYFC